MTNTSPIKFESLAKIEVPVSLGGVDYLLLEADGAAITERDNAILSGTMMADGKPVKMNGVASVDAILLSRCLIDVKNNHHVNLQTIHSWPARVRDALIERLKEISGITDSESEADEIEDDLGNS